MKTGILLCGVCGVTSAFLGDASVWAARHAMTAPVVLYILGFAIAAAVGARGVSRPLKRWHVVAALTGTCASLLFHRGALGDVVKLAPILKEHTVPSLLFAIGFYGGVISAVGALLRPSSAA